jgi:hypothetical protein
MYTYTCGVTVTSKSLLASIYPVTHNLGLLTDAVPIYAHPVYPEAARLFGRFLLGGFRDFIGSIETSISEQLSVTWALVCLIGLAIIGSELFGLT